nr:hypothetical protein [Thermus scotoductus]
MDLLEEPQGKRYLLEKFPPPLQGADVVEHLLGVLPELWGGEQGHLGLEGVDVQQARLGAFYAGREHRLFLDEGADEEVRVGELAQEPRQLPEGPTGLVKKGDEAEAPFQPGR